MRNSIDSRPGLNLVFSCDGASKGLPFSSLRQSSLKFSGVEMPKIHFSFLVVGDVVSGTQDITVLATTRAILFSRHRSGIHNVSWTNNIFRIIVTRFGSLDVWSSWRNEDGRYRVLETIVVRFNLANTQLCGLSLSRRDLSGALLHQYSSVTREVQLHPTHSDAMYKGVP